MRVRGILALFVAGTLCIGCQEVRDTPVAQAMGNAVQGLPGFNSYPGLDVHAVRSSREVIIHKIAVMPLVDQPDQIDQTLPPGASEAITAELYARANVLGGWQVVPQDDIEAAMQQMPPVTLADMDRNALELGRKVTADGVLYGTVMRYRERVGYDYAAQTPAAVAFSLKFVDEHSQQVIWTAKFAREQKSLAENVLDLPNFLSNAGRWVRAHDIASEGVQEALVNLQSKVSIEPIVQGK